MPTDDVTNQLKSLGLRASKEALRALLEQMTKTRASAVEVCEKLAALERRERDARNLASRVRQAMLGKFKALDAFDWSHPRSIDRALYEQLRTLDFIETANNVLFRGPSGVGKTMLAQNLGQAALERGYTVRFATLADALADLLKQESLPALERRIKRYTYPDLLILDELGYLPCDSRAADLLYNIISRRHEKRATIFTTNLPYKQWGSVFQGAACVVAMIDRFAQHCYAYDIDGDSWRQKNAAPTTSLTVTAAPADKRTRKYRQSR
jgi:DNA replication protein DnaC